MPRTTLTCPEHVYEVLAASSEEQAQRHLYKYTDCGAWVEFTPEGVRVGSIVEGADFGTHIYPLSYPMLSADLDARIKAIEEEADLIWQWANEGDQDIDPPYFYPAFETDGISS